MSIAARMWQAHWQKLCQAQESSQCHKKRHLRHIQKVQVAARGADRFGICEPMGSQHPSCQSEDWTCGFLKGLLWDVFTSGHGTSTINLWEKGNQTIQCCLQDVIAFPCRCLRGHKVTHGWPSLSAQVSGKFIPYFIIAILLWIVENKNRTLFSKQPTN